jgi:ABC-type transporter Mla maintaining outer membrane lipid asymmetry permease subunit MlaE
VFFSTFDAVAGLATGWLHHAANRQTGAQQAATLRAADELFNHNWLTGNLSVAGSVTAVAWAVIAIAGAAALRRAGANRLTVALMAASVLFVNHPVPTGTLGMLALFAAAFLWDRRRRKSGAGGADSLGAALP